MSRGFFQFTTLAIGVARARVTLAVNGVRHGRLPAITGKGLKIANNGSASVGNRFRVGAWQVAASIAVEQGAVLSIGHRVFLNQGVRLHASRSISIGDRVEISDFVAIYDTNFHRVGPDESVGQGAVRIGDDCWIGAQAIILPGVSLGRGAVVGAGSVVTKSFESGSVIAGNPAKLVRKIDIPQDFCRR